MFEFLKRFRSEDANGARTVSKTVVGDSTSSAPANLTARSYPWVASHWHEYMRKEGWKAYPCLKHAVEYCAECTVWVDRSSICCE